MKKYWIWLITCILLLSMAPCSAEQLTGEEALEIIDSYLTEVYSYTTEEAAKFTATAVWEQDHWRINFASSEHPEWIYTATYQPHSTLMENVETPFWNHSGYPHYPGEGSVREGLNRARKGNWFTQWSVSSQNALQQYMAEWGITATPRLTEGLALGTISAADALYEYFVSCYGQEKDWTMELHQWYEAEVAGFGLTAAQVEELDLSPGVKTYETVASNKQPIRTVRFIDAVPQELEQAFSHPKLQGWICLCGTISRNVGNGYGYGLAAFEKEGERLLVALRHEADETEWLLSPVSKTALYTDRPIAILPGNDRLRDMFIVYPGDEMERFGVAIATYNDPFRLDACIDTYTRMDETTGSGFTMSMGSTYRAAAYENHQKTEEAEGNASFPIMMSQVDVRTFPTSMEAWKNTKLEGLEEYAMSGGVHLRQRTSSRSKDLGEYKTGTLVKVLGVEPGDPHQWYRVQVGRATGYMSSLYVDTELTGLIGSRALPVAKARKEIRLKKGMSLFSGSVTALPVGTMMHVLAECDGGWLHVSVPQGKIGWQMDVNGTDGYVKEKDVLMAGTPLMLEWME